MIRKYTAYKGSILLIKSIVKKSECKDKYFAFNQIKNFNIRKNNLDNLETIKLE